MEVLLLVSWLLVASAEFDRNLTHIEDFLEQKKYVLKRKYKPRYHISAPVGWLNNPNGFVYFKRRYHIFYQYHPYDGSWGSVTWGHVVSDNLINWSYYPPALLPKDPYDKEGCLAGSAVIHNTHLTLFYTGNLLINNKTIQNQNIAVSADGVIFQKYLFNPVIHVGPFGNSDFRNPMVWQHKQLWYMLLGSSGIDMDARLLLYTSFDLFNWKFNSTVLKSYGDMGRMWEIPDFFELNGTYVLILSVQFFEKDPDKGKYSYRTGYITGNFSYSKLQFENMEASTATFNELDYGHDFYAAKTTLSKDGRRLMIAWLGVWDDKHDEWKTGWASMLTLVRELHFNSQGKLLITPVKETVKLRNEVVEDAWYSPGEVFCACAKAFELIVNSSTVMYDASIILEWSGDRQYSVTYNSEIGEVTVNRAGITRRADWKPTSHIHWHIFVDYSSIEVFCGNGDVVFSSRIFPKKTIYIRIAGDTQLHVTQYKLKRSVGYNNKVRKHLKKHVLNKYN